MAGVARADLAASVSEAGGLGSVACALLNNEPVSVLGRCGSRKARRLHQPRSLESFRWTPEALSKGLNNHGPARFPPSTTTEPGSDCKLCWVSRPCQAI